MELRDQVEPSGARHEVGVDELFFSTTDARGVISQANSVFVRLSRYRRDQLVGAPHNLIRHPDMPGGAFFLMWEALQAGQPYENTSMTSTLPAGTLVRWAGITV